MRAKKKDNDDPKRKRYLLPIKDTAFMASKDMLNAAMSLQIVLNLGSVCAVKLTRSVLSCRQGGNWS